MALRESVIVRFDALAAATDSLHAATLALADDGNGAARAQRTFAEARRAYKRVEYLLEYHMPTAAEQMNGPPLDEVDLDEGPTIVIPREGFQVLEELLFPQLDASQLPYLRSEAQVLRDHAQRTRRLARSTLLTDQQVFDALRTEIARIVTLGITGFDSPVRRASLEEASEALAGIGDGLAPYRGNLGRVAPGIGTGVDSLLRGASAMLAIGEFDSFDRLAFTTEYANPLAVLVAAARDTLGIRVPTDPRLWRAEAATLFERDAFDPDILRPAWAPPSTPERVALGERLFFDPILSGTGTRSCASCHLPERAFTDGLARSIPLVPGLALRNAPTLINAALQNAQFADLRTVFLEDQVTDVVTNRAEMHGLLGTAAAALRADPSYGAAFEDAYGAEADSAVGPGTIRNALAAYVRSLVRLDSPVDRALRGESAALSVQQRLGFNVFAGKGLCATCHFLPLTSGLVPPAFIRMEQEVLGVPATRIWSRARVSPDSGRATITRAPLHRFAFKTPSVRNSALTAPYMHNGVYRTFEDVIRFYDVGGGAGIGIDLPNQTLPFDELDLTEPEKSALVAFLRALTDTTRTTARSSVRAVVLSAR